MNARSWTEAVTLTQREKLTHHGAPRDAYVASIATAMPRTYNPSKENRLHPILHTVKPHLAGTTFGRIDGPDPITSTLRWNTARDKQLMQETTYDPITNRPKLQDDLALQAKRVSKTYCAFDYITQKPTLKENLPEPIVRATETFGSGVPYNIVKPHEPLEFLTDHARRHKEPQLVGHRPLANYAASRARRRVVDPITNKYVVDNEERQRRDTELARHQALTRYWQSRNLDPLTMTYHDPAKEEEYQQRLQASQAVQGMAAKARLPPSIGTSLGQSYDIVHHLPRDEAGLGLVDTMDGRVLRRFNKWDQEQRQMSEGNDRDDLAAHRSLSRATLQRYHHNVDPHGYDILHGGQRDPHLVDQSYAGRPPKAWDRITTALGSDSGAEGRGMGMGRGRSEWRADDLSMTGGTSRDRAESAPAAMASSLRRHHMSSSGVGQALAASP